MLADRATIARQMSKGSRPTPGARRVKGRRAEANQLVSEGADLVSTRIGHEQLHEHEPF